LSRSISGLVRADDRFAHSPVRFSRFAASVHDRGRYSGSQKEAIVPLAAPRFRSAAVSDRGFVRPNNEDRVYCDETRGFFMVVDGMGGREGGEHAAEIAVERIRTRLERQTGTAEQRIREAITLANNAVFEAAQSRPDWEGMACVLTVALIEDGDVTVGHVGDSRLYRIRGGAIEKMTHDHSPVGEREDTGELSEAEAMRHPRRNEVFRDVGSQEHTPHDEDFIEVGRIPFETDSALLICSDGLSDAISSGEILSVVQSHAGDRESTVQALIEAAKQRGKDNVSAVFIEGDRFANSIVHRSPPAAEQANAGSRGLSRYVYGALVGALLTFGLLKLIPSSAPAHAPEILPVASPSTIAAAIEKARPGDTVSVAPGVYPGTLHLKSGVDVIAQRAHDTTIEGSVFAEGIQKTRLEGFRIHPTGAGVRIVDSDVVLMRNEITGASGAGVEFSGSSRGDLVACWIHDNAGPGVAVLDTALPSIENNQIGANGMPPAAKRPGLLITSALMPLIAGNTFQTNGAEAIWLVKPDTNILQNNFFSVGPGKATNIRIVRAAEVARESR
jgi:serine/threonine protein phosphatase PrpC